jgi:hypothetical protein
MPTCPTIRQFASRFTRRRRKAAHVLAGMRGLLAQPACERRACRGARCPSAPPVLRRTLKYSCGILPPDLFFENVRQRVGCVSLLTLKIGVLSIAVEQERSLLTANKLRIHILCIFIHEVKPILAASGGNS